jgi:hypothetical protein
MRCVQMVLLLAVVSCTRPAPPQPVAGIYAVKSAGTYTRGEKKKAVSRRAQAGKTLSTDLTLELEKGGAVLESFDGSFVYVPAGKHPVRELGLRPAAAEGATRRVQIVTDKVASKDLPMPVVQPRYEPPESRKPFQNPEDEELQADVAFFFTPHHSDDEGAGEVEDPTPKVPPAPWMVKDKYIHPLRRPVKEGDSGRVLVEAKGAVVVEFADQATSYADSLKLPLDLSDVKRIVVADGSARLVLPSGQKLDLKTGEIAEIGPLP